jgi:hypothetical protein
VALRVPVIRVISTSMAPSLCSVLFKMGSKGCMAMALHLYLNVHASDLCISEATHTLLFSSLFVFISQSEHFLSVTSLVI